MMDVGKAKEPLSVMKMLNFARGKGFEFSVPRSIQKEMEFAENPPLNIEIARNPIDDTLFLFPPLVGKTPNEDYQKTAISRGLQFSSFAYFLEQGLGKSYIISMVAAHHWKAGRIDRILVLSPRSGLYNLKAELIKFGEPFTEEMIAVGGTQNREPFAEDKPVVFMTYDSFRLISDHYHKKVHNRKTKNYRKAPIDVLDGWGTSRMIVADESHKIANMGARRSKVVHMHKKWFKYRYPMSGTPMDKIEKLYSQIRFMDDNLIPMPYQDWIHTIANVGTYFSEYAIDSYKPKEVEKLLNKLSPFYMRILQEEALDLPPHQIHKVRVPLSDKHQKIYRTIIKSVFLAIKEQHGSLKTKFVKNRFPYIMMALDNPTVFQERFSEDLNPDLHKLVSSFKFADHGKIATLRDLIETHVDELGEKMVIWSTHPKTMINLEQILKKYNPICIHGEMEIPKGKDKDQWRHHLVEEFKHKKKHKIIIASSLILDTAITMTQANVQVYFDRNFNQVQFDQSIKRIYRNSQTKKVNTYILFFEKTVEVHQDNILNTKSDFNKKFLKKDFLSKNEWEALFDGDEEKLEYF
jgi:SNF2 family DNA or RNA helicase